MEVNNKNSHKKTAIKIAKISAWVFGSIAALIIIVGIIFYFSKGKIKAYLIQEINKNLITEISVDDIDITFWSTFPYVSLVFENVVIPEVIDQQQGEDTLIMAQSVYLQFNLWDVLRKQYVLRRVFVESGYCKMKVFEDGKNNYEFWKTDTTETDQSDFELKLNSVRCEKIEFAFDDYASGIFISLLVPKFKMTGNFYENDFAMNVSGELFSQYIEVAGNTIIPKVPLECSGKIHINIDSQLYTFTDFLFKFKNVNLYTEGTYLNDSVPFLDFKTHNDQCALSDLQNLLPYELSEYLQAFENQGNVSINMHIKGPVSKQQMPFMFLSVSLQNGKVSRKESDITLTDLAFNLDFTCNDLLFPENSTLTCSSLSAKLKNGSLKADFQISGFTKSEIQANLKADMKLEEVHSFFRFNEIEDISGRVLLDLSFKGKFKDLNDIRVADFLAANSEGTVQSDYIDLKMKGFGENVNIKNIKGKFTQSDLTIENIEIRTCQSDFQISGTAFNIFPFLFLENQTLHIKGKSISEVVYVDQLFAANVSEDNKAGQESGYWVDFSENIRLDLIIQVDDLYYDSFSGKNLGSKLLLNNKLLLLRDMKLESVDGKFDAEVIVDARKDNTIDFRVMANVKNANMSKAFKDFNNFGQTSLTHEHLKGFISGSIHFSSVWSKNLEIDMESVTVVADIEVIDGAVKNYEPLAGLRKYFKRRDFSNVEFDKLTNQIVIKNKLITIPQMQIKSSVMDFEMHGTHNFDNEIDYHFKIQFAQLLKQSETEKKPRAEDEYGTVKDDNDNQLTWHFKVTGTVDDPKFVPLDVKSATTKMKDDFKKEGQKTIQLLQEEFGSKKDDTEQIIEHGEDENKRIIIEWDDE